MCLILQLVKNITHLVAICQVCNPRDNAGIPIFLKNNLKTLLPEEIPFYDVIDEDPMLTPRLIQEFPKK